MPPPKRPPSKTPPDDSEGDPSTFYARVDPDGNPIDAPPPAEEAPMKAPKKGLQVSIPDDDEPPPPPKPKAVAAPVGDKKGRRGNWWDTKNKRDGDEEEPTDPAGNPDDQPGATAMLKVDPPPERPKRRAAPPREDPEPPPEEPEQPTFPRRRAPEPPRRRQEPIRDDGRTQMLDINNLPSPEELRQQAAKAKAAANKVDPLETPGSTWTATRILITLLVLTVVCAAIAGTLAFVIFK